MSCLEPCNYSTKLLEKLKILDNKALLDFNLINKAIYWAKKYHGEQKRKSGELFYSHPLEVAYMIADYNLKTEVIVASILHDIVEDTEVTVGMIVDNFSWRIAEMVDRLTRDRSNGTKLSVEEILINAYKYKDQETILIKLVDRLHNIQTINAKSDEKIRKTIDETVELFIAVAIVLQMTQLEQQLIEICYKYLPMKPSVYHQLNILHSKDSYQLLSQAFENTAVQKQILNIQDI